MNSFEILFSCSAPNVQKIIYGAIEFSYWCAAAALIAVGAIALDYIRVQRRGFALPWSLVLFAGHPVWWENPWRGDCGSNMTLLSVFATGSIIGLFLLQRVVWKRQKVNV